MRPPKTYLEERKEQGSFAIVYLDLDWRRCICDLTAWLKPHCVGHVEGLPDLDTLRLLCVVFLRSLSNAAIIRCSNPQSLHF
jgi:hypothetical protein